MAPFADYANFADCVRQNPQADDPAAYCGSIQARTENKAVRKHKDRLGSTAHHQAGAEEHPKAYERGLHEGRGDKLRGHRSEYAWHGEELDQPGGHSHEYSQGYREGQEDKVHKAVTAASHLHQAVRLALSAVVAKAHDPVKEEGDKKLKEADGVAAEGAQDDQAFAVAFGPDNYDKLTKRILVAPYREAYQAAGAIVKAIERKQMNMNFPGDLENHLKKAHAAVHGREMWDNRYSDVCDLLKKARKLLHDIEREAEAADQEQQGQEAKQVVGKADPTDSPAKKPVTPQVDPGPLGTTPLGMKPSPKVPQSKLQTPRQRARTGQTFAREQWGGKALKAVRKAVVAAGR